MSTEIRLMKCKTRLCNCEEVQEISCLPCGMEDYTEDDWDWDEEENMEDVEASKVKTDEDVEVEAAD